MSYLIVDYLSLISSPPRIQSKHERLQNKNDIEKFRLHNLEEEQNLMITEQQNYNCNDKPQITSIDGANISISKKKVDVNSQLHQISAKDKVKENLRGNERQRGIELVNITVQHKNKHEDAGVNNNINHTIAQNSNAHDGNKTMITNNEKGCKKIVTSGKIFESETIKDTKSIKFKQTKLSNLVIEAKTLNALETWAVKKENTIAYLIPSIQTSKTNSTKKLLEQREGKPGLRVTLKTDIDSSTKRKIDIKENQNEITRLQESEVTSQSIEKGKEIMRVRLTEDIIEVKISNFKFRSII